ATAKRVEAALPALGLMSYVVEKQRPDQASELSRPLGITETPLVLDERHDLLADPPQERLDLAALRGLVRCDPAVHLAEFAVKRERLGALLFGQLLRHQKRKEEPVLRQNVRRETRVSPGMVRWVLVISVRQDDDLLELALRSRGVGRS